MMYLDGWLVVGVIRRPRMNLNASFLTVPDFVLLWSVFHDTGRVEEHTSLQPLISIYRLGGDINR